MSEFVLYFQLGREHIMDIHAYDHILFVIALCVVYAAQQWKQVLILVTAFTIGHSLTLALVTLGLIRINVDWVEMLIPITIIITALGNIFKSNKDITSQKMPINYFFALFFGLIHGMGFSNYLSSLLGADASIVQPLFSFNLGLEVGQVIIVTVFMGLGYLVSVLKVSKRDWVLSISAAVAGVALTLLLNKMY